MIIKQLEVSQKPPKKTGAVKRASNKLQRAHVESFMMFHGLHFLIGNILGTDKFLTISV